MSCSLQQPLVPDTVCERSAVTRVCYDIGLAARSSSSRYGTLNYQGLYSKVGSYKILLFSLFAAVAITLAPCGQKMKLTTMYEVARLTNGT